jgi:hypothetical protein
MNSQPLSEEAAVKTQIHNARDMKEKVSDKIERIKSQVNSLGKNRTAFFNNKVPSVSERLNKANARGDDSNLATHGHDRKYYYSIYDSIKLVANIRQKKLNYTQDVEHNYPIKAQGEEYSPTRQNHQGILITNPYHELNFQDSLADDIKTIMGRHTVDTHNNDINNLNNLWDQMPNLLIIPILYGEEGGHWRAIRAQIDYTSQTVYILWDDPYGADNFNEHLTETLLPCLTHHLEQLIRHQTQCAEFVLTTNKITCQKKPFNQQGEGNGYDCGPIIFSNITNYANPAIANIDFIQDSRCYTVSLSSDANHEQQMVRIRANDANTCQDNLNHSDSDENLTENNSNLSP